MRCKINEENYIGMYFDDIHPEDLLVIGAIPDEIVGRIGLSTGIYDALWQLSLETGLGLRVDVRKVPIPQADIDRCNREDTNPYEIPREGEIYLVHPRSEYHLRKDVTVIGYMTKDKVCKVINGDRESYLKT